MAKLASNGVRSLDQLRAGLTENDFEKMGILLGPRKMIMQALGLRGGTADWRS